MKKLIWLAGILLLLASCRSQTSIPITILDGSKTYTLSTSERLPAKLLSEAKVDLGANDRLLYLGSSTPLDVPLPEAKTYTLMVSRAVKLTVVTPSGQQDLETSAPTVGQALAEAGYQLYAADRLNPPAETPLNGPTRVDYTPSREYTVSADGGTVLIRSAAGTVGQALAEAGIPLEGLDYSLPAESAPLPEDGRIRIVRVVETVALTQKSIPFESRSELTADLEIDQQALLQAGRSGLAITRTRIRSEDGVETGRQTEGESIVRPAQDRVMGYGTKIVFHSAEVESQTITYWRVLRLYATSYSPCQSASPDGRCLYYTSSRTLVRKGEVAMAYYWYLLFGHQQLYITGYGYATVEDVGGGCPPAAAAQGCPYKSHYWVDLGWTDEDYQPMQGWVTVYFLGPVEANPGYILP